MTRTCGDCQLCCKLMPMAELAKPAGVRCEHQRVGKGCMIYAHRPSPCRLWQCRWLASDDTADLRRPDRSHYFVDMIPDHVTLLPPDGGEPIKLPVIQIWVDPNYPEAHRDPALRAYLQRRAADGFAALIRYNASDAFALFAPALSDDGKWHEVGWRTGAVTTHEPQHRAAETAKVMAEAGTAPLTITLGGGR